LNVHVRVHCNGIYCVANWATVGDGCDPVDAAEAQRNAQCVIIAVPFRLRACVRACVCVGGGGGGGGEG
jgi:hypothetical protein